MREEKILHILFIPLILIQTKMKTMMINKIQYLKNAGEEKLYFTSDGKAFYTENAAKNYAATLTDQHVEPAFRPADSEEQTVAARIINHLPQAIKAKTK
jgi:hypothetical protein